MVATQPANPVSAKYEKAVLPMAHDVFISHSHQDKPAADAACAALEARGIRCWIAPRDIAPGQDWAESIVGAIRGAQIMLLVFSRYANQSAQVKREVERAASSGKVLLPLRIDDVVPEAALEYYLGTPHWLDAITPPLEAHLEKLADACSSLLAVTGADQRPPGHPPPRVSPPSPQRPPSRTPPVLGPPAGQPTPSPASSNAPQGGAPSFLANTVGATIAVVVLVVASFVGYHLFFATSDGGGSTSSGAQSADAAQIKQLVQTWTDDFNNRDLAGMQSLLCSGSASELPTDLFPANDRRGSLSSSVGHIEFDGDRATAGITSNWSGGTGNASTDTYAKEGGVWKICHTVNY
jgi:hypothetical protein